MRVQPVKARLAVHDAWTQRPDGRRAANAEPVMYGLTVDEIGHTGLRGGHVPPFEVSTVPRWRRLQAKLDTAAARGRPDDVGHAVRIPECWSLRTLKNQMSNFLWTRRLM